MQRKRVVVLGAGLMGAQIALEYALGGWEALAVARDIDAVAERLARAEAVAIGHELATRDAVAAAARRITITPDVSAAWPDTAVVVESLPESLAVKAPLLAAVARACPDATIASNTSSIPIGTLGEAAGAPERTVGAHYWNPPLLMPLVEIIAGAQSDPARIDAMVETVAALGKRPVRVDRDVPGFVWNRLQFALLREAAWIVEQGVAAPGVVDLIVRDGLARRWTLTGPFETAALGGAATFEAIANLLWPELSTASTLTGLGQWLPAGEDVRADIRTRRDNGLADALRRDRGARTEEAPR
jgi:3-hydroxybutyryl-CoA dehydrogenase